ncbi:MAG TPA: nuclear transport factor 2 family protein [Ferruginibacter sp.]|jgi:ketosteroid isomerase-like protein|nr:nuclear transport factor 2 family protein [Ferruginibacter sp.]
MKTVFAILLLLAFANANAQKTNDEQQVRAVLAMQQASWNNGNLDMFMQGYWKSDSVMFIGSKGIVYGWQNTMDGYKKGYPDTASMGKLQFTLLEVKRLSVMYFFVVGKWELTRTMGNLSGHFTLLFKKIKGRWVIVADHSS